MFGFATHPLTDYVLLPGFFICSLFSLFSASTTLRMYQFVFITLLAAGSAYLMQEIAFQSYGYAIFLLFSISLLTQATRGGVSLFLASGWRPARLRLLRLLWLCGAPMIPGLIMIDVLPVAPATLLTWIWCLAGILISRFTPLKLPAVMLIWPLMFIKSIWDEIQAYFHSLPDPRLQLLMPLLFIVTIFMLTNMYHAEQDEHYFS
jgi:hypothetical protein